MHRDDKAEYEFKNFHGDPINDPRPDIDKSNAANTLYNGVGFKPINYRAEHKPTQIHIAERWGRRRTQEDRVIANQIPLTLHMSQEEIESAIRSTLQELSDEIKRKKIPAGSTFNMSLLIGNKVYNANVGDSESFLVIRDKDKKLVSFERLNREIHEINENNAEQLKKEGMRIETKIYLSDGSIKRDGKPILPGITIKHKDHRIADEKDENRVNMYRSMGDTAFEKSGLVHTPDISVTTVDIPPGGDAFVINSCDGLTEIIRDDPSRDLLKKLIGEKPHYSIEQLVYALAVWAETNGSKDNITVSGTMINPDAVPRYMAICDGHSGIQISQYLSDHFHTRFVKNCGLKLGFNALNEEQRIEYLISYNEIKRLSGEFHRINPHLNLDSMFESISNHFINTLQEQKNLQEKSDYIVTHWSLLKDLAVTIHDAIRLTRDMNLSIPSSLSPEFSRSPANATIKNAVIQMEAKIIAAVTDIAYHKNGDDDALIKQSIVTLKENTRIAKEMIQKGLQEQVKIDIKNVASLLDGRPFLSDIHARFTEIPDKLDKDPSFDYKDAVRQLLLEAYLEIYKHTQPTTLLSSPSNRNDLQRKLERTITDFYPDVLNIVPHSVFPNSTEHQILYYAGSTYPDLVSKVEQELQAAQEAAKENLSPSDKTLFLNTSKLLARIGDDGFDKASTFFNKEYGKTPKDDEILAFIEAKASIKHNLD